jgi:hypothetical protein
MIYGAIAINRPRRLDLDEFDIAALDLDHRELSLISVSHTTGAVHYSELQEAESAACLE